MALSLTTIVKRNINVNQNDSVEEQVVKLTHVRLDRENINEIENLECLGPITNLYLQHNFIKEIKNLESVAKSLTFLSLANNQIRKVDGLLCLSKLALLDLSCNLLDDLNCGSLPKSLAFVSFKDNPCSLLEGYREELLENLPNLKSIDGETIFSDSDSESESEDEEEIEEERGDVDIKVTCVEVLERCSSRMNEVGLEHKSRKIEIETKKEDKNPTESDDETSVFEKRIQHVLNEMILAERNAMANDFQLPSHITNNLDQIKPDSYEVTPPGSPILMPTKPSSASKKSQQLRNKINVQNNNLKSSSRKNNVKSPQFSSMGTTTSKLPSKTLFGKSDVTVKVVRTKKHPIIPDINSKKYKTNNQLASESLIRIPGARPFHKT